MSKMLPIGLIALVLTADVSYFAHAQLGDPGGGDPEIPPCDNGCFEAVWKHSGGGTGQTAWNDKYFHEAGQGMVLWAPVVSGAVYCYDQGGDVPAPIDHHPRCIGGENTCLYSRAGTQIFGNEKQVVQPGTCESFINQLNYCDCSGGET